MKPSRKTCCSSMPSEVVTHSLGRCVPSVEPRRVALIFNEHLLCARLFRTLQFALAWSDEVSHSADEQIEATSIRRMHGVPWGLVQSFKEEPCLLPQGQGQGVSGMLPPYFGTSPLPTSSLWTYGGHVPSLAHQNIPAPWFRDEHVTSQLKTSISKAFPRAVEGNAGNVNVELLVGMGASSRKSQTVHEANREGSIAERQALPPLTMWSFSKVCTRLGHQ